MSEFFSTGTAPYGFFYLVNFVVGAVWIILMWRLVVAFQRIASAIEGIEHSQQTQVEIDHRDLRLRRREELRTQGEPEAT